MFNTILRTLREERGLYQNDLANMLNISQSQYSKYELGVHEPDIKTFIKLANFFNVSVDYLIGNSNIQNEKELLDKLDIQLKEIKTQFKEIIRNK